ncbi:LacI family DNA-binding transcriptional regulator [Streptomyces albidus (ex Kaewkla and Franco 2022)]|uniref:LacI family DNA-binding transcriptional regulator n=1 Tax=Streptomyces albidus (ex Kaewkla and Franco 2022) TaxID=722709 RepID=UPI0015EFBEAA|nr:LacI family DNA-binding transcriptional regulator [Streptomyces albidus (ex Kaewkla and Franco 2022)]
MPKAPASPSPSPVPGQGSHQGGSGSVTMAMVARRAGVSTQTVSNALNTPDLLRPETLERVRQAVDEMGYRPHRAARSLRTRASRLIGFGIEPAGPGNVVLDRFLHALSETADAAGYRLLLFAARPGLPGLGPYEELLSEHGVDAFVLSGTEHGDPRQAWLEERGIPFVAFGRMWCEHEVGDWVDVDGAAGTEAAVAKLASEGHRNIGFLGWPPGSGVGDDRAAGWQRALRTYDALLPGHRADSVEEVDAATAAALPLLDAGVTAVVAASDTLALGCHRAIRERGGTPGRDVSVVGFDDSTVAPLLNPGLASVAQPLDAVGREAMRLLLARMADPAKPPERVLLPPALVLRASLGSAPG